MTRLTDRVVVVTGGGRGIGFAYASYLAGQGAHVVVNDLGTDMRGTRDAQSPAHEAVARIRAEGGTAVADEHDIAVDAPLVIETALSAYGRIDGVVNNAGIVGDAEVDQITDEQIARVLGTHIHGALNVNRAAWPHLRAQGHGRIVNISSAAVFGVADAVLYGLSKGAIVGMTRSLAQEGKRYDIAVNAVLPLGRSRMADTQAGLGEFFDRWFPADRIAPFVGLLLSAAAPCTGELFAVGGGRAARVFLGTVPGLVGFQTLEDCLAGFDQVMAADEFVSPMSMDEEMAYEMTQLGVDLSSFGVDLTALGTAEGHRLS